MGYDLNASYDLYEDEKFNYDFHNYEIYYFINKTQ